jgi:hypothetical protein
MFAADCSDGHVSLLQSIFGREQHNLRFPERLGVHKIDSVFRLVALALLRIDLELHRDVGIAFTPAMRLSAAAELLRNMTGRYGLLTGNPDS